MMTMRLIEICTTMTAHKIAFLFLLVARMMVRRRVQNEIRPNMLAATANGSAKAILPES